MPPKATESATQVALNLVRGFAAIHSITPQRTARRKPEFDADRAWRWIVQLPDVTVHRPLMRFAAWLWSTGTHDLGLVIALLEDRIRRNPANPYAYYAPGGTARDCFVAKTNGAIGECENEAFKAADREFLGQR